MSQLHRGEVLQVIHYFPEILGSYESVLSLLVQSFIHSVFSGYLSRPSSIVGIRKWQYTKQAKVHKLKKSMYHKRLHVQYIIMTYGIKCYPFFQDLCTKDLRNFSSCLNDALTHDRSQKKTALATLTKSHTALKNSFLCSQRRLGQENSKLIFSAFLIGSGKNTGHKQKIVRQVRLLVFCRNKDSIKRQTLFFMSLEISPFQQSLTTSLKPGRQLQ